MLLCNLLLIVLAAIKCTDAIQCKNHHDEDVSWFVAYKMPKMAGPTVGSAGGVGFYYLDANDKSVFRGSPVPINVSTQAIGYTLQQYYSDQANPELMHAFYNDEPAIPPTAAPPKLRLEPREVEFGHTKGIVIFDEKSGSGVWILHSAPKFPPAQAPYAYPGNAERNGQTFICLTLDTRALADIGTVLYYSYPIIYSKNVPKWAAAISPDLNKAASGQHQSSKTDTLFKSTVTTKAENGITIDIFSKSALFNNDLWQNAIAPAYKISMDVETWRTGHHIPLDCTSEYPVFDAESVQVSSTAEFTSTKDHSKYGRSISAGDARVCIGDINRMTTQYVRGGGAVCVQDAALWKAFNVFKKVPTCPSVGLEDILLKEKMLFSNKPF